MIMDDYAIETAAMLCHAVDSTADDGTHTAWQDLDDQERQVLILDVKSIIDDVEGEEHSALHVAIVKTLMDRG